MFSFSIPGGTLIDHQGDPDLIPQMLQDHTARAELAVKLLIQLREQAPVEPEILLPVKLIQRNSTGPVRTESTFKKRS